MSGKPGMRASKPSLPPVDAPLDADPLGLVDGRSRAARSIKERLNELQDEVCGQSGYFTPHQLSIARRLCNLEMMLDAREARMQSGELPLVAEDLKQYLQATQMLLQLRRALGLDQQTDDLAADPDSLSGWLRGLSDDALKQMQTILDRRGKGQE